MFHVKQLPHPTFDWLELAQTVRADLKPKKDKDAEAAELLKRMKTAVEDAADILYDTIGVEFAKMFATGVCRFQDGRLVQVRLLENAPTGEWPDCFGNSPTIYCPGIRNDLATAWASAGWGTKEEALINYRLSGRKGQEDEWVWQMVLALEFDYLFPAIPTAEELILRLEEEKAANPFRSMGPLFDF